MLLNAQIIETDLLNMHRLIRSTQFQILILMHNPTIEMIDILRLTAFILGVLVLKRIDLHMVQANSHVQIDEIIGCPKFL